MPYLHRQHSPSTDSTIPPPTAQYLHRQHSTSTDSTVPPLAPSVPPASHSGDLLWPAEGTDGVSGGTVLSVEALCYRWRYCAVSGGTVLSVEVLCCRWGYDIF
ncbi:hypothetical protein AMTR_s00121p00133540 [Amborella trichopoda]|uniref:Uncharacterized protein n=1 Tax=Amborella trichopoda TaxID=13333 RepID=W1NSE0_AMBTC|nr:hypothetical protein AMTR_s00121p00133540 [Amborella trichopoda]